MKLFKLLLAILLLSHQGLFAQDTLAYEVQRQRVNELLDQRSSRFGQFNQSLEAKTGFFGLKTKKDMQASIDILKEIVITDNNIFKETKVLLDYKDMEKTFISYQAEESKERINGYVKTISKQQKIQEEQSTQIKKLQQKSNQYFVGFLFSILVIVILVLILIKQKLPKKPNLIR